MAEELRQDNPPVQPLRTWDEVAADGRYQKLPPEEKSLVQRQWFEEKWKTLGIQEQPKAYGRTQKELAWSQFQGTLSGKPSEKEPWLVTHAPDIGGLAGGIAGIEGGPVTAVPFAAAGGAIGNFVREAWRREYSPATAASSFEEKIGSAAASAAEQGVGEGVGQLGNALVSKAYSPIRARLMPKEGAPEAQALLQKHGGSLSVGQAVGMEDLEAISRNAIFSRGEYRALDAKNKKAILMARNDLLGDLTNLPPDQITRGAGDLYQKAIQKGEEAHQKLSSQLYGQLDDEISMALRPRLIQAGKVTPRKDIVDMTQAKAWANAQINDYRARGSSPPAPLVDFLNTPDRLTFQQAFDKRSDLLSSSRDASRAASERSQINKGAYDDLARRTQTAMDTGAQKLNSSVYQKYREASDFYREGKQAFTDDVIVKLSQSTPERVAESLFRPGNETEILRAKEVLQKAAHYGREINFGDTWGNMQAAWLTKQLESRAVIDAEQGAKGSALWKTMNADKDRRTFNAVFEPHERQRIKTFIDAVDMSQKDPSRFTRVGMFMQGTALTGLLFAGASGLSDTTAPYGAPAAITSTAILLTPEVIGRIMTRPGIVNKLTGALKLPRNSPQGVQAQKDLIPSLLEFGGKVVRAGVDATGNVVLKQTLPTLSRSVLVPQAEEKVKEWTR